MSWERAFVVAAFLAAPALWLLCAFLFVAWFGGVR